MSNRYTFWRLLLEKHIVIPIIQRDFAQGRDGQEYVRKNFLEQLGNALGLGDATTAEAELDFVYGTEYLLNKEDGKDVIEMLPLDGQQRLTTLWLLHFYVAYRAKKLPQVKDTLRKFTYETRTSSREFCYNLCKLPIEESGLIESIIKRQIWFFSGWLQDPTIRSMLRMLSGTNNLNENNSEFVDGIEELFSGKNQCDFEGYWEILTGDSCPIHFNFFPLQTRELPVSDDLYIKMNARGKELTDFENLKADLINWIRDNIDHVYASLFASQLDNDWTDLFWNYLSKEKRIDEIFFAFINRFFYNELLTAKRTDGKYILSDSNSSKNQSYVYLNDSKNENDYDLKIAYTTFNNYIFKYDGVDYKQQLIAIIKKFEKVMASLSRVNFKNEIVNWFENYHFDFIPTYELKDERNSIVKNNADKDIVKFSSINQVQRVAFYAICKYFNDGAYNDYSFQQWRRFIWNFLSVNDHEKPDDGKPYIRLILRMQEAIELIDRVDSHDAYATLADMELLDAKNILEEQFNEEINKAKQIIRNPEGAMPIPMWNINQECNRVKTWEDAIIQQERNSLEPGVIRYLFTNDKGQVDWNDFSIKSQYYKNVFIDSGLIESNGATILKQYISFFSGDQFLRCLNHDKRCFNNKVNTWKYFLMNTNLYEPTHKLLTNQLKSVFEPGTSTESIRLYQLSQTALLDFVVAKIPFSWIRGYHFHEAIFPSDRGVFLNAEHRDSFFALDQIVVDNQFKVPCTNFYYGSDIGFIYILDEVSCNLLWNRDDVVYLMAEDWKKLLRDEYAETNINKYYCFNAKEMQHEDIFIQIQSLWDEYNLIKSELT